MLHPDPIDIDDDAVYTAARARQAALRAHPDVQKILTAAATADRATLRRLHDVWLGHFNATRIQHTRLWHQFVRATTDQPHLWRDVLHLGDEAYKIIGSHPYPYWGAGHAVADAVKAVHMAPTFQPPAFDADTATLFSVVYNTPWFSVTGGEH